MNMPYTHYQKIERKKRRKKNKKKEQVLHSTLKSFKVQT